jgi:hypothetical protein
MMAQTMYTHMNKCINNKKEKKLRKASNKPLHWTIANFMNSYSQQSFLIKKF